ncbi:hypothetical protein AAVH_23206 [Aphelenchoides avenae]|nr:hypothetical protein AAVH_23206 [Aphelenchus avenae]
MLCPVICMVVPVCIPLSMAMTGRYVTLVSMYICLVGVSIFPLFNALLTIVFVSPYRAFTMKWIRFVMRIEWKPKVVPPPDPSSLQSNAGQQRISVRFVSVRAT